MSSLSLHQPMFQGELMVWDFTLLISWQLSLPQSHECQKETHDPWVGDKDFITYSMADNTCISIFTISSLCPMPLTAEPLMLMHAISRVIGEESSDYGPISFIIGSKLAYLFLQRETKSQFSKTVHYTNILEKIIGSRRVSASVFKMCKTMHHSWIVSQYYLVLDHSHFSI